MEKEKKKANEPATRLPIRWRVTDSVVTRFVSNMVIQKLENEFKISFFELKPEIHLLPDEPRPNEVIADCVGSFIITPDRLPKFIGILQRQLDLYNEKKNKKESPSAT